MKFKSLYLFVEGTDDDRFFKHPPIFSRIEKNYQNVEVIKYRQKSKIWLKKFISSINSMEHASYIYVKDLDTCKCITEKIQEITLEYPFLDPKKILIVVKEIEGWYIAGLDNKDCKKLKIPYKPHTNDLIKEELEGYLIGITKTELLIESLKYFSVPEARRNNKSFDYFLKASSFKKYNL